MFDISFSELIQGESSADSSEGSDSDDATVEELAIAEKAGQLFLLPDGRERCGEIANCASASSWTVRVVDPWEDKVMMLERSGSSITVVSDSHLIQKPECRACTIRLLCFAVLLLAQDAPADPRWLPARDVLFKVVSEVGLESSQSVGQICAPEFLAFALDRIQEAWKVPSIVEAELWTPKAMSYNCAGIPAGTPFVAHTSSLDAFEFLIFKSADVHAAVGPFVPGSSTDISLLQSAGRLILLPVSQRLDASNPPSAVLRLIRSIQKTEALARSLLELAFQKVIDRDVLAVSLQVKFVPELINLLRAGDVANLVLLCDAMLPRKKRTPVPADVQQLLLYRADLTARSCVNCPGRPSLSFSAL
jgi:hypothetical protein